MENSCLGLKEQILVQHPNLQEFKPVYLDDINKDLPSVFPKEHFLFISMLNYFKAHLSLFFYFVGDLFCNTLTIDQMKDYKLLDLSKFFSWAETHLKGSDASRLERLKRGVVDLDALFKKDPRQFNNNCKIISNYTS